MSAPASYACLPRPLIALGDYAVRPVQPDDIEDIRQWRNAQMDVLRQQSPLTPADQIAYYDRHVWPVMSQAEPANILVTFLKHGQRIGYGGLVHIAWPHLRAEVSFLVSPDLAADAARYAEAFDTFFGLVKVLAFDDLGLNRLTTETYTNRTAHIARLEAAGFIAEGRLRRHVRINDDYIDSLLHGCVTTDAR
jgi:RimJ/RimL family protein N-acetyltransferase